ncbi:MAG: hypothetical protein ACRDGI_11055 [Candidatus Limnocylindrales bacterium]
MWHGRLAIVGLILVVLAGCAVDAGSSRNTSSPGASVEPSNGLADPVIVSTGLPSLTGSQTCAMLTAAEAAAGLAEPLKEPPLGTAQPDDHSECVYQAATEVLPGTYIRIAFNTIGFAGQATLVNLHRGAHTLRVGGFEAIGADAQSDPVIENAVLCVKLAKGVSEPALWIEAPTLKAAEQAALIVLGRLAAPR